MLGPSRPCAQDTWPELASCLSGPSVSAVWQNNKLICITNDYFLASKTAAQIIIITARSLFAQRQPRRTLEYSCNIQAPRRRPSGAALGGPSL